MFLLKSIDLIALISLFVQTFVAWVFVAIFASIRRRERSTTAFDRFLISFTALACALTFVSVRFFRTHDRGPPSAYWADGNWPATVCYIGYLGCKAVFALFLLRGCNDLASAPASRWLRRLGWPLVAALALAPLFVPDVNSLLVLQAPLLAGCALIALRALVPLRTEGSGLRLVRISLGALAGTWGIHVVAVLLLPLVPAFRYLLAMNSMLDLAVQLALGTGLIIGVLQESQRRMSAAEAEREQLQRALDRDAKLRALGTLVSGVAHELNNPLTVILGYADLVGDPAQEATAGQIIREQAERCRGIVRNLSALAGQSVHPREDLAVEALFERVVRGISPALTSDGRHLRCTAPAGMRLRADRIGIEQVLTNLVVNALQASPRGGTVTLEATLDGSRVILSVTDEGPGIAESVRTRLFEPFFTTKAPGEGTGLGLSIAHAIVRAHRGTISVDTVPRGRGAHFRVMLPQLDDVEPPVAAGASPKGRRLLVIDDDPGVRAVVRRHAEQRGWVVAEAESAEAALDSATRLSSFDATLCDLRMPGIGGVGLHDRLVREDPVALQRTIFVTGDLTAPDLLAFARRCQRPLMQKPFDFSELFAAVDSSQEQARTS